MPRLALTLGLEEEMAGIYACLLPAFLYNFATQMFVASSLGVVHAKC
uniref:Uncharacterized protein n=1 Tax=Arundo donax TaxID=35708 RepID=A0A0A9B0T6_ARUDO